MKIGDIFSDLPQLETERTILRKVSEHDEEDMFAYCCDDETARYTTWERHHTIEDTRTFINFIREAYVNHQVAPWGIEDKATGKMIGTCGFAAWDTRHSRAEIAYVISKKFWGQGYMTELVKTIIAFGFSSMDLVRIEARCLPENIGSARVMEKVGMAYEGILRKHLFAKGRHHDVKMYAIVKE